MIDPARVDLVLVYDHLVQVPLQLLPRTQVLKPLAQDLVLLRTDDVLGSPVFIVQKVRVRIEAEGYLWGRASAVALKGEGGID